MRVPLVVLALGCAVSGAAFEVGLPTPNDALWRADGAELFFQPTVEGTLESGMFGCRRRGGRRFHEGVDIRCVRRDRRGECVDPVWSVADGRVVFVNRQPSRSNYGRYVVVEHEWDGVRVWTLYAHLAEVTSALRAGQPVSKGGQIGIVGRSANTREGIPPERAHLHFEIAFMLNPHFDVWYRRRQPKAPSLGPFNGQNFAGIDPVAVWRASATNSQWRFREHLSQLPVGFTVLVRADRFPWRALQPHQCVGDATGAVAFEVAVTPWGLPVRYWPVAEVTGPIPRLTRVNEALLRGTTCRQLVVAHDGRWRFSAAGREWLELLTFVP
ncbi:MAG: M23 family metallopeptidase [Verrucomicrobiae bacterium]|nr:M23 family metallopeptidase [Verrucomicrobiae bacterium]